MVEPALTEPVSAPVREEMTLEPLREPEPVEPLQEKSAEFYKEYKEVEPPAPYRPPERRPAHAHPSTPPPPRAPVETEPSALRQAIQEVEQIIDDVNEIVEEMHHVLDLLTKLEKQNKVKDSEIESLRSSLASLRRRVEGARAGDYHDQNRRR